MAVVSATRDWSKRNLRTSRDGSQFDDGWTVIVEPEEGIDPRVMILDSGLIPLRGDPHDEVFGVVCRAHNFTALGPRAWSVIVTFETVSVSQPGTDPTLAPPQVRIGGESYDEPIDTDLDGNPVATTAGEPFDPPISRKVTDLVIDYTCNVLAYDLNLAWLFALKDKVNDKAIPGLGGAGQVLVDGSPEANLVRSPDGSLPDYYQVSLRLKIREPYDDGNAPPNSAWFQRVLNQGYRHLDDEGNLLTATDDAGIPFNQKVLLDAAGKITTTPYWLYFRIYEEADLSGLNLQIPGLTV